MTSVFSRTRQSKRRPPGCRLPRLASRERLVARGIRVACVDNFIRRCIGVGAQQHVYGVPAIRRLGPGPAGVEQVTRRRAAGVGRRRQAMLASASVNAAARPCGKRRDRRDRSDSAARQAEYAPTRAGAVFLRWCGASSLFGWMEMGRVLPRRGA